MNIFKRQGLIYKVTNNHQSMQSHCQVPFAIKTDDTTIRIYFATRDSRQRSVTAFIECDIENPKMVKYVHPEPSLELGKMGNFDDSGSMPSWFIRNGTDIFLYYSGWNAGGSVPYRLGIGLAISTNGGVTFDRYSDGPILDRSIYDTSWCAQPCVMKEMDKWRMWYLSCSKWEIINDHPEPFYNVKYAESKDGIYWERTGDICLDFDDVTDAIGRPVVIFENDIYKMFYSYRRATGYRTDPDNSYRLGYAESLDGVTFTKKNHLFDIIGKRDEWESVMNEYCHIYEHNHKRYLIYNGDGFGKSGFGYAIADIE
jgi:hypothetical protein